MKNTLMGTETVPMERFHLVQKLYSFLDIPGAAWDLDLLIYLFCSSRKPSEVRGIRILAGAGADLARVHIIQGRINPQGEVDPFDPASDIDLLRETAEAIGKARPSLIPGLNDRANDAWEPLLAIADQAGDHWPKSARNAAIALHGLEGGSPSIGAELLADVKAVFEAKSTSKVFSADLLEALVADEEAPWATWNRGKPMSPRQLSAKQAEFGIKSKDIRIGSTNKKGYDRADFSAAFGRYLSPEPSLPSATARHAYSHATSRDFKSATPPLSVADKKTSQPSNDAGCHGVADKTPPARKGTGKAKATLHDETDREEF
ncbi:DUF3631 domain-containing protein [Pseudomonas aeruginosa]|uniref:DUF3631 domain-containing protein n=1 Tax=Pseudomonas aeruginosa TaxID=287 RepID=UPI000A7CE4F9|nr:MULTISPECIES: DUF3631 domain-containing protein [Pseudomonas]MCS8725632.1 DUF3631 domain-containing protein [Pseudomonas aeruginosa]MCS8737627.1 DUF3631 domain-containing protein [Pseudomonas aeruginosa]MCT5956022.1 DUF3631 domain-containing protein [Pseudomonas aeruginosa]MCY0319843.1 DUF3631 domain-containing protein [Pseudomonas aeruginosa]MCY0325892.1 DUF3631 domain-containing protein [Pseudomonas aeruginosa]